jgi:hypothetical protein
LPEWEPEDEESLWDWRYVIELTLIFWALLAATTITLYQ